MRLHYAENNRKSATFFATQSFPKAPQSIDKQRKTPESNGFRGFLIWCSSGDSNPGDIDVKPLKMQYFSIIVSILVSILRKEIANPVHLLRYVRIRKVRIDFAHNLVVFPAAQTHGYHHRHLQMIA